MSAEKQNITQSAAGGEATRMKRSRTFNAWTVWVIFALELLLLLVAELPGVADFKKFGFYDEGSWLHMDVLFAAGKVPTVDFGYSYGMLPLILGHASFALFGRTPAAFIAFVTACNLVTAWGIARILEAACQSRDGKGSGIPWHPVALACLLLPYAIFPNNYSLMHPLEMMLIVLALAQQARGKFGAAVAFATLAVLAKPTMGYVLGLLLLVFAWRLGKNWKVIIAPALAGSAGIALELCTVGTKPLIHNLLPLAGGKSYVAMHFGFFHAGRDFWLHQQGGIWGTLAYYVLHPPLLWIIATVILWSAALLTLAKHMRRVATPLNIAVPPTSGAPDGNPGLSLSPSQARIDALLITLAILHAAFVFLFYAWSGSWTYYSYLWVLGLLIVMLRANRKSDFVGSAFGWFGAPRGRTLALCVLAALGLWSKATESLGQWTGMVRKPDTAGLWTYPDFWNDAEKTREIAGSHHALYLVNGNLPAFWPEAQTPAVWFLSPGIQTPAEIAAIHKQIAAADMVITLIEYDPRQEAWNWPEFQQQRSAFDLVQDGPYFRIWQRRPAK